MRLRPIWLPTDQNYGLRNPAQRTQPSAAVFHAQRLSYFWQLHHAFSHRLIREARNEVFDVWSGYLPTTQDARNQVCQCSQGSPFLGLAKALSKPGEKLGSGGNGKGGICDTLGGHYWQIIPPLDILHEELP